MCVFETFVSQFFASFELKLSLDHYTFFESGILSYLGHKHIVLSILSLYIVFVRKRKWPRNNTPIQLVVHKKQGTTSLATLYFSILHICVNSIYKQITAPYELFDLKKSSSICLNHFIMLQRSALTFNKTIIYQMEELHRKWKEENKYW